MKKNKKQPVEITIELKNIDDVLSQIPDYKELSKLNILELAGTAAMLRRS